MKELKSEKKVKMKQILLLAVLCFAFASGVELENLCSADTFKFEGLLVNAFHRAEEILMFEPLSHYLISDIDKCDPSEFKNKRNYEEAVWIART